jgi:hypothetical protein
MYEIQDKDGPVGLRNSVNRILVKVSEVNGRLTQEKFTGVSQFTQLEQ